MIDVIIQVAIKIKELEKLKENKFIKFANKEKEIDDIREKAIRNCKKFFEVFIKHEKERFQSNQNNPIQPISPKNQNQPSNKDNYPWGVIISMGVVITILLGIVIFLLTKNKRKN